MTYISLNGAHSNGPMAKPSTKSDIPRVAISSLQSNSRMISSTPPEYAEDAKETAKVAKAIRRVMVHFLNILKPSGSLGSQGMNSTLKGSWTVPEPA